MNVDRSTVSNWERGTREPPFETVSQLAALFGVSVDYLLGRTDNRGTKNPPPDLAARWPNLSPERRQRAYDMERAARGMPGTYIRIPEETTNETFDALMKAFGSIAQLMTANKKPDHS